MKRRKQSEDERNKLGQFDRLKSLQDLDGQDWGLPDNDGSHLVRECTRLHRVQLKDFTTENLRIMIGQDIGLDHLMPLALEKLRDDPFAEGDCYGGDLLHNVLSASPSFWMKNPDWAAEVVAVTEMALALCATSPEAAERTIPKVIQEAFADFRKHRQVSDK